MNPDRATSPLDRIDDSRPTMRVPAGSPCRAISGCSQLSVPGTGRCEAHAETRCTPAPTVGKLEPRADRARLAHELVAIATDYVQRNMGRALEVSR